MGSRLFSNTTNLLGGHDFLKPEHRRKVAHILGIDAARIPDRNSWSYHEIIEGIRGGAIKGLWVIATNPAHSWIHQNDLRETLGRLDFLVVQDMYTTTETAQLADLLLPAAAWGEKDGTLINSERRIGLIKKVSRAPGLALTDFVIFQRIARAWGCESMFEGWSDPEAVFQILKELSRDQPCDFTGIADYRMIDEQGGIQWPYPAGAEPTGRERRLFEDGAFYHPDRKARFLFEPSRPMPEAPCPRFPLLLLTGRGSVSQWHTQTRTSKSAILGKLAPRQVYLEINPDDARALNVRPDQHVLVESARGKLQAKAAVTYAVQPGQVFLPMHYEEVNRLTHPAFDPYSKQPSYKACAVRISPLGRRDASRPDRS
jgi:assimilatory nitrate reductase catalytic subunit